MRLTLRQLEVFDAVCRTGSVTAAAQAVSLSQSAASQALAELELALDGVLFDRVGRRLQINERGQQLRPHAVELIERATLAESALRGRVSAPAPRLHLAASLTIGGYLLPPLLAAQRRRDPSLRIDLQIHNTMQVVEEIAEFRADAGFVEGLVRHPDVLATHWRDDEMVVVASPGHPLVRRKVSAQMLAEADWVMRESGSGGREIFERAAHSAGFTPRVILELGHPQAVLGAVIAGAGFACLSRLVVVEAIKRGELVALKTTFLDLHRPLWMVMHRQKFIGAGLKALLAALVPAKALQKAKAAKG